MSNTTVITARYEEIPAAAAAMLMQESQNFAGPLGTNAQGVTVWQSVALWLPPTEGQPQMRARLSTVPQHGLDLI